MYRTRIFLSCGQDESRGEVAVARSIAARLEELGFDVYIAVEQQNLLGVKEAIFKVLEDAEYYVFVDFCREALDGDLADRRGSVFTHQELALASFLEKEVLAFRETGVRKLDGVAGFLQTNAFEFTDRPSLPAAVVDAVKRRGWRADWYNGLTIDVNDPAFCDAVIGDTDQQGRFFHLAVRNRHRSRHAEQCVAYLESVIRENSGTEVAFDTVEYKWAGFTFPYARIAARNQRLLDAFWLLRSDASILQFNAFTDSNKFVPRVMGPGVWLLRYSVTSATVRGAQATFRLRLDSRLGDVRFDPVEALQPNTALHPAADASVSGRG